MPENIEAIWDEMDRLKRVNKDLLEALEFAKLQLGDVGIKHSKINEAISKAKGGE